MRVSIYILLVKSFFTANGVEYADAIDHRNISTWPNYKEALQKLDEGIEQLNKIGYKLSCSDVGEEDQPLIYCCRFEKSNGRAVVFEIIRKKVEGDLFLW